MSKRTRSSAVVDDESDEEMNYDDEEDAGVEEEESEEEVKKKKPAKKKAVTKAAPKKTASKKAVQFPFKSNKKKTTKKWKLAKQIIAAENYNELAPTIPTYVNIDAPPSLYPAKKYCDLTGLEGRYTDPRTGLRYHSSYVYKHILAATTASTSSSAGGASQSGDIIYLVNENKAKDYLSLRRAAVELR